MYTKIYSITRLSALIIALSFMLGGTALAEESTSSASYGSPSSSTSHEPSSSPSDNASNNDTSNNFSQDMDSESVSLDNVDTDKAQSDTKSDALYEFNAGIGMGFEFNDNINDDVDNRVAAFMTHIRPSFSFQRLGGRIVADINYSGDYTFYLGEKSEPEYQHTIDASVTAEIIKNFFFLNVSESMQQVYENVTQGEFQEGQNEDDARNRNVITINPYVQLQPSERTNIRLGYTFTDTRYSMGQDSKTPSFLSLDGKQYDFSYNVSQSHEASFRLSHELSERAFFYTGGSVNRIMYEDKDETDTTRYTYYVGGSYAFSEQLSASLEVGPNYSVPDTGNAVFSPYVQASINYAIGRSVFALSYNTSFEDDPESGEVVHKSSYGLSWNKDYTRTKIRLALSYNTFVTELNDDSSTSASTSGSTSDSSDEQGNTFSPSASIHYELTPRLSSFITYSGNIYENHRLGDHTHTGSYGLSYQLSEQSTLSLSHRIAYTIPYEETAYTSNQVMLDFSYRF